MTPGSLEFVDCEDMVLLRLELHKVKGLYYCKADNPMGAGCPAVAGVAFDSNWIDNMEPPTVSAVTRKAVLRSGSNVISQGVDDDWSDASVTQMQETTRPDGTGEDAGAQGQAPPRREMSASKRPE